MMKWQKLTSIFIRIGNDQFISHVSVESVCPYIYGAVCLWLCNMYKIALLFVTVSQFRSSFRSNVQSWYWKRFDMPELIRSCSSYEFVWVLCWVTTFTISSISGRIFLDSYVRSDMCRIIMSTWNAMRHHTHTHTHTKSTSKHTPIPHNQCISS